MYAREILGYMYFGRLTDWPSSVVGKTVRVPNRFRCLDGLRKRVKRARSLSVVGDCGPASDVSLSETPIICFSFKRKSMAQWPSEFQSLWPVGTELYHFPICSPPVHRMQSWASWQSSCLSFLAKWAFDSTVCMWSVLDL
jgi:hypothetical protein